MRILKLIVQGYRHIELSGIRRFEMNCVKDLILILGTNGSGKSSLLALLTPNVPMKVDFREDGYVERHIEHSGKTYILISNMSTGKHQFILDGENLNPGGTGTVQRNLAETIFNYTPLLHELLTGNATFTHMSPSQRRVWLERLCDVDVTYASTIYDDIKKRSQALTGAIKINKERMIRDTDIMNQMSDIKDVEAKIDSHTKNVSMLMGKLNDNLPVTSDIARTISEIESRLSNIVGTANSIKKPKDVITHCKSKEQLISLIETYKIREGAERALHSSKTKLMGELEDLRGELSGDSSEANLIKKIGALTTELNARDVKLPEIYGNNNYSQLNSLLETINSQAIPNASQFVSMLPDVYRTEVTSEVYNETCKLHKELQVRKNSGDIYLLKLNERIKVIKNSKEETCPKCKYVYIPGHSEYDLGKCEESLLRNSKTMLKIESKLSGYAKIISEYELYLTALRLYREHLNSNTSTYSYFKALEYDVVLEDPSMVGLNLCKHQYDLMYDIETRRISDDLDVAKDMLATTREITAGYGIAQVTSQLDMLYIEVSGCVDTLTSIGVTITKLSKYLKYINEIESCANTGQELIQQLDSNTLIMLKCIERDYIKREIKSNLAELATVQQQMDARETMRGILADLSKSIDESTTELGDIAVVMDALSPNTGIIAEQLTGFSKRLVAQINIIIDRVWEYNLQVLPCKSNNGSLDYKFPLLVNTPDSIGPDIKKGSQGQRDIINFAFTLLVSAYLGLMEYPLYLDELGASFDAVHREKLMREIQLLISTNQCSQLFIVQHYESSTVIDSNTDVCVLDPTNVVLPVEYNQNVIIN